MGKTYDDRGAGDLRHFAESIVMVVIGRAEVGLASGEATSHFHIQESIGPSKARLHVRSLLHVLGLGGQRAEQRVQLVVRLSTSQSDYFLKNSHIRALTSVV